MQRELNFDGENCKGEDGKKSQSRRVFNIKNIKKKKKKMVKTCWRVRSSLMHHVFFLTPSETRPICDEQRTRRVPDHRIMSLKTLSLETNSRHLITLDANFVLK